MDELLIKSNGQWKLEKGLKEKIRNVAVAGAITAGSMIGGNAQAEMLPHKDMSATYLKHAFADKKADASMTALHGAGLMPVVHFDHDTGESKLTIHDAKTKRKYGHIDDGGDFSFPNQKMRKDHFNTIKDHVQTLSSHFQTFLKDHADRKAK